jgi:endoglucanase
MIAKVTVNQLGYLYRIVAGDDRSHPFRIAADLYDTLARDAFGLFYLLRSGCPIDDRRAPGYGRPAGHTGDAAVRALELDGTFDVSGGWYDAGDYGKYVVSGGIALWQLLHLLRLLRRRPGVLAEAEVAEECRWQLDWLLRMQVPRGRPLAGMAFHRVHGTIWPRSPRRPPACSAPTGCWPPPGPRGGPPARTRT